jgi:hypothetical protein
MAKGNKYEYRVVQDKEGGTWMAEITRRVTSRKTVVSKSQGGFATEAEALAWGEEAIQSFVKNLVKQSELRTEVREEKAEKSRRWLDKKNKNKLERANQPWKK